MFNLDSNGPFSPFRKKTNFEIALDSAIDQRVYAFIEIRALAAKVDLGILYDPVDTQSVSDDQVEVENPRARLIEAVTDCQERLETVYGNVPIRHEEIIGFSEHPEWARVTDFFVKKHQALNAKKIEDARWRVKKYSGTAHYYRDFEGKQSSESMYSACGLFLGGSTFTQPAMSHNHRCGNCSRTA
jgi:hypothetical protein